LFDPGVVAELGLIRTLRTMDVPLAELKRNLDVRCHGHCNCNALKCSIQARIQSIDQRLTELVAMKTDLSQMLSSWQECGGARSA
jgi:DNA-binding transcriptional MerR regulator